MPDTAPLSDTPALPSVRGLISGVSHAGALLEQTTLLQWLRLSADKFHLQKVDVYLPETSVEAVQPLLEAAAHLDLRLSVRTTGATSPEVLPGLAGANLLDVALEPAPLTTTALERWNDAARRAGIPLRLVLDGGALPESMPDGLVDAMAQASAVTLSIRHDLAQIPARRPLEPEVINRIASLTARLLERGVDVRCHDIPFCQFPKDVWPAVMQTPQRLADHQHYAPAALDFARKVYPLHPDRAHQAIEITLGKGTSFHSLIDDAVLPWILQRPRFFFWTWFLHKLTRRMPWRRARPASIWHGLPAMEAQLERHQHAQRANLGPECARCRLHPICDHHTETFKAAFPGRAVAAQAGPPIYGPGVFLKTRKRWYDAVDAERLARHAVHAELAREARGRLAREKPTREIPAESYDIQDHETHHMPASVRWFSFSTAMLQSTVLARVSPPFTLSVTLGGGIAELAGFALGRHTRLLCPMTAHNHRLTLHVDPAGRYVLLRDGEHVVPMALHGEDTLPERIGSEVEPRIALANIDGQIVTQTVLLWENGPQHKEAPPTHSVVIVCTRYARRLQAALLALAHQTGMPANNLEVIVGYVPGIDATDDVLDSLAVAFPAFRLVRAPFPGGFTQSKGFIINECIELARGTWITLLDADIMLPPDYFARLDDLPEQSMFVAPEGRHMLSPDATASLLLGQIRPWEDFDGALELAGERRDRESEGVPPGFCQSVRRAILDEVRYGELDHFEGSDWWFSAQVVERFGKETRLEGLRVLHLDHEGSQWYGTRKQF